MQVIRSKKTGSTGNRVSDHVNFEMVTDVEPTSDQVAEEQRKLGYHPAGYGGPNGVSTVKQDKHYKTVWYCYASCD